MSGRAHTDDDDDDDGLELGGRPRGAPEVDGGRDGARRAAAAALLGSTFVPEASAREALAFAAKQHTCSVCALIALWLIVNLIIQSLFEGLTMETLQQNVAYVFKQIRQNATQPTATTTTTTATTIASIMLSKGG